MFPKRRLRRLRKSAGMRRLMRQTRVAADDLVCPVFVSEGIDAPQTAKSMPNVQKLPPDMVAEEASKIWEMGIPAVMPVRHAAKQGTMREPLRMTRTASYKNAIRAIRKSVPKMVIMADVCMCQYTNDSHCGIVRNGKVENDLTLPYLGRIATSYARAGADVVTPSSMMDGQVVAVRSALDEHGHTDVAIMSQSAKHSSTLYSPFRDTAHSAPEICRPPRIPSAVYQPRRGDDGARVRHSRGRRHNNGKTCHVILGLGGRG